MHMISTRRFPLALPILLILLLLPMWGGGLAYAAEKSGQADDAKPSTEKTEPSKQDQDADKTPTPDKGAKDKGSTGDDAPKGGSGNAKAQAQSQIENSMANIEVIQQTLESLRKEIENSKESADINRSGMQTVKDGLDLINNKLKDVTTGLDQNRGIVSANTANIEQLKQDMLPLTRDTRANIAELNSQKSLIEDNSIRLYEILIQLNTLEEKLKALKDALVSAKNSGKGDELKLAVNADLNRLWMLLSIVLVFFAPLAFVLSGRNRQELLADGTEQHQGMLLACLGVFLGYFVLGFGLMYGTTYSGWIGASSYLLGSAPSGASAQPVYPFPLFVLYHTGFAMLSALIVYVAVGSRLSSAAHMVLAVFVGAILMPVFGHWAWSGYFIPGNKGWLEGIGFTDQGGSTVINSVSAWFAFALVWKLELANPSSPTQTDNTPDEPVYSSSATLLLWLSWFGFTTAALPISSDQIPSVMLNTGLAAAAGGMTAFLHYVFFRTDKSRIARGLSGFVSGLVAVAACAQSVTFMEAAVIGACAGLLQNMAFSVLRKYFLKQAWQVRTAYLVAIHGVGGVWGTLCFALLGTEGNFDLPDLDQLVIQAEGAVVAIGYSVLMTYVALMLLSFRKKQPQPMA
ncbi:hypothetical protein VSS37_09970 [Candidatus Thiothrix sp. Deng01]|uniref:Ammonium transporter AmtB-like domain-containing protein n=1 Tax=Candidatus Thiothrix phosphatis TaxID=3112415 RepID=A0ABU6CYZ2_9GAMM|nr:hypothetical protein [Candidatus Thiothrix sp. Deng01]MEB4591304.1 hypothetical protein [Candidatus Thiothrix sp. Deng01]